MSSYAQQVVELYSELAGVEKDSLKAVPTPCLAESAIIDDDLVAGSMQPHASCALMKALWLARLARPNIYFVVIRLASFVTRWTRWHDEVLHTIHLDWTYRSNPKYKLESMTQMQTSISSHALLRRDRRDEHSSRRPHNDIIMISDHVVGRCVGRIWVSCLVFLGR